ncbi:8921_t:CDS:2 [Funneliformis mosseae]|uniref:8921_t:CDS:1 n=1 Tax=Funneliformis mosseae TaxID=27381 RepID=A0A9N9DWE4_FUNMO|nr:8921_t:CDS:2 [Funneliformis mosseae]
MKAIDKAMEGRFQYKDVELKWKRDERRSILIEKKERRHKELLYTFNINNNSLEEIKPSSLSLNKFKKDCKSLIKNGGYYSDKISETDNNLTKEEITKFIQPKNKKNTDKHVLHVYNKLWKSRHVCDLL